MVLLWLVCLDDSYFKMVFIIGSVMFSELESLSVYSGILRLVTMLQKKKIKDWATWLSSKMILSFSINIICSLDIILSEKKRLHCFPKYLCYAKVNNFAVRISFSVFIRPIFWEFITELSFFHNFFEEGFVYIWHMIVPRIFLLPRSMLI